MKELLRCGTDVDRHEHQRQHNRSRAPTQRARQVVPNRRRHGEQNRNRNHRVRSAKIAQKRNQQQATAGRAEQIEEIHAVHALDGFPYSNGNHRAREKEGKRARKINSRQREVAIPSAARQNVDQRRHHRQAVHHRQNAEFVEYVSAAIGHNIGKQAARAQSEQGDRDGEKREVVEENHRENPRERQLQNQRRKRGKRDAQIELRPLRFDGFSG